MSTIVVLEPDEFATNDTVKCLQQLLALARKGEVIGLGFVALRRPRRGKRPFYANTAGVAHLEPTLTRGMLLGLDDKLSARVYGGNP